MIVPKVGGYRPDPDDARDKPFMLLRASLQAATGTSLAVLPLTTPLSNQGPLSSCVANATCDAFELLENRPTGVLVVHSLEEARAFLAASKPQHRSRLHIYFFSRAEHGDECRDDGTFPRCAFSVGHRLGFCAESLWPYKPENVNVRPPIIALQDAYDHRVSGYYRITARGAGRGEDVRAAIDAGMPIVFGVDVSEDFTTYDEGEHVTFEPPSKSVGGHAMVIVGYRELSGGSFAYLVRNSWGTSWGLRSMPGHCWISERYLATASDLWVPTKAA